MKCSSRLEQPIKETLNQRWEKIENWLQNGLISADLFGKVWLWQKLKQQILSRRQHRENQKFLSYLTLQLGRGLLDSWVVSHSAVNIGKLCHALGHEFASWWWQTRYQTQAQHFTVFHDSIWLIWFVIIFCLLNLSCELWRRKLKTNEIYFKKS